MIILFALLSRYKLNFFSPKSRLSKIINKMFKMVEIREKLNSPFCTITYITDLIVVAFISSLFDAIFCSEDKTNIYI